MKKFKQKEYTIQEGHFTGTKDLEKVPSTIEVLTKSTLGGSAIGAVTGGFIKEAGISDKTGILDGASKGGKAGFLAGIIIKLLLNNLHKPMSTIKYQEVDKMIRQQFGIHRLSGFTVGDTLQKRKTLDEKFGFNDRNVEKYKISFSIYKNQVTMYTLGLSEDELDRLSASLDYYCKKYFGMEYTSRVLNSRSGSYSVTIVFTNYSIISDFIMEVSEVLGYKINILDNEILLQTRLERVEEKEFTNIPILNKYDLTEVLFKSGVKNLSFLQFGPKIMLSKLALEIVQESLKKISDTNLTSICGRGIRKNFDNKFLKKELDDLGYYEGVHYGIDLDKAPCNMCIVKGIFMITTLIGSKEDMILGKIISTEDSKSELSGKVNLRSIVLKDKRTFDILLDKIIKTGIKPNIYIG